MPLKKVIETFSLKKYFFVDNKNYEMSNITSLSQSGVFRMFDIFIYMSLVTSLTQEFNINDINSISS